MDEGEKNDLESPSSPQIVNTGRWNSFQLYEYSVNSPEEDADFLRQVFRQRYGHRRLYLREDFCGTAKLCCEWIKNSEDTTAVGIDNDLPTLEYAKQLNISKHLSEDQQSRVKLHLGDVQDGYKERVDVIAAHNFLWMMIRDRQQLREYFKTCRQGLKKEGILLLDIYGGPKC